MVFAGVVNVSHRSPAIQSVSKFRESHFVLVKANLRHCQYSSKSSFP